MANAKIGFSIGTLTFSGEGEENWLSKQLDKLLQRTSELAAVTKPSDADPKDAEVADKQTSTMTLVAFLQKHQASTNQIKKYVATALWVMSKQNTKHFLTKDVTSALANAQQSRLGNPGQSLARAIKAGHVEKQPSGQCFVTPAGKKFVGVPE